MRCDAGKIAGVENAGVEKRERIAGLENDGVSRMARQSIAVRNFVIQVLHFPSMLSTPAFSAPAS